MDLGTSSAAPELSNVKYEDEMGLELEPEEDVLADYFEKTASAVRHTFSRCVSSWVHPYFPFDTISLLPRRFQSLVPPASSRTWRARLLIIS